MRGSLGRRDFLKLAGAGGAGLLWPGLLRAEEAGRRRPNFVVILGEGQGWASTSVQMDDRNPASRGEFVRTPNLERLAREGMRFARAYCASPRCTPARACLFTGVNPAQLHMTFVSEGGGEDYPTEFSRLTPPRCVLELPAAIPTIGTLLKGAGYATAHFGKWHVGRVSPSQHGFDESDGATSNVGPNHNPAPNPEEAYGMTERGMAFMARQAQAGKPFYLQLSHYAARGVEGVRKETYAAVSARTANAREKERIEAGAMEDVDRNLGTLLKKIDDLGLAGDTYVIYTSDHGTPGRNGPLAGGKGWLSEGGIRVPLIVRGPGVKAGACSPIPAIHADLLPTFAALAGAAGPLPANLDGGSLAPLLATGEGRVKRAREELLFHYPHYDHGNGGPQSALILGSHKLVRCYETGKTALFDLEKDPGEGKDLAAALPDRVAELGRLLDADLKAMGAQMAEPNPNYDPAKAVPADAAGGGGGRRGGGAGGGGRGGRRQGLAQ